jgi:hypothetical protein
MLQSVATKAPLDTRHYPRWLSLSNDIAATSNEGPHRFVSSRARKAGDRERHGTPIPTNVDFNSSVSPPRHAKVVPVSWPGSAQPATSYGVGVDKAVSDRANPCSPGHDTKKLSAPVLI